MRWRIQLSYLGTAYCGWQRQPGDPSVQQTLEEAFSMILRQPVEITGCGRTDTGVHARKYVAHTDFVDVEDIDKIVYQLNAVLPHDISIHGMQLAEPIFHARFDALRRQYKYYIHSEKNPFSDGQSFYFIQHSLLDKSLMHEAASLLLKHEHFKPFCKTGSDADHYRCIVTESAWTFEHDQAVYSISANRFLRGMVRLVVGMCLNVGLGKISINELIAAMDNQSPIPHAWSVPPEGLFLEDVIYP